MPKPRITLQNIADQAGVARSTVSKALHNSKELLPETCQQIQDLARQMGYQPDPVVSNLMQQLRHIRNKKYLEPLAFISAFSTAEELYSRTTFHQYLLAAEERGIQLGYQVQHFWFGDVGWSGKRLTQVLRARGIRGVLLAPVPGVVTDFQIDWDQFATVAFGYSLRSVACHRITNHQYHSMLRLLQALDEYGYRRICLVFPLGPLGEARINNSYSAALYVYHQYIPEENRIDPIREFPYTAESLRRHIDKLRPDVIISSDHKDLELMQQIGLRVPEDIGVAFPGVHSKTRYAGINQNVRTTGAAAVDLVAEQLYENKLGVPTHRKVVLIEGQWQDGDTIRIPAKKNPSIDWNLLLNQ